jgi:hypothetical protein
VGSVVVVCDGADLARTCAAKISCATSEVPSSWPERGKTNMPKSTATLLTFTIALNLFTLAGCDQPIDHDAEESLSNADIPADAFVIGKLEVEGVDADALRELALAAAAEDAGYTADPSLVGTLAAPADDPVAGCTSDWGWWKCCGGCCANMLGDYYCQY